MDRHKYDQAVRVSASQFIQAILSESVDEANDCLARSREGLLRALSLCGATVELNGQQFLRRSILERVGSEVLAEARKGLFATVFPRCDPNLRMDIADAFDAMEKRFRELALPVLH